MEHITYKEAADLLGVKVGVVRTAACRGKLTKAPSTSMQQHVIKEQVMLFKDKKQIRVSALSDSDREIWSKCDKSVKSSMTIQEQPSKKNVEEIRIPPTVTLLGDIKEATETLQALSAIGAIFRPYYEKLLHASKEVVSKDNPFIAYLIRNNELALKQQAAMFDWIMKNNELALKQQGLMLQYIADLAKIGLDAILFILHSLSEYPTRDEIVSTVKSTIPDNDMQEIVVSMLCDTTTRDQLKELLAA